MGGLLGDFFVEQILNQLARRLLRRAQLAHELLRLLFVCFFKILGKILHRVRIIGSRQLFQVFAQLVKICLLGHFRSLPSMMPSMVSR